MTHHRQTGQRLDSGTVFSFDFGLKRIGVAVGDLALKTAHPLTVIREPRSTEQFKKIESLIQEWKPVIFVVGIPSHPDGAPHAMTEQAKRFARRLEGRFKIEAVLIDERWTSVAAESDLRDLNISAKHQKDKVDQLAAQLILQTFFNG